MENLLLMADSYKYSHHLQFPSNVTYMHSYLEARESDRSVRFFGLQYYLLKYLAKPFTARDLAEAKEVVQMHGLPFNEEGWQYILDAHNGYLPLKIRAVKEGAVIPGSNILMTVESTDENAAWLVGYVETLLMKVWYPTTVCTLSYEIKTEIQKMLEKTADTLDKLPFMLHDFGYRGTSSEESAAIGGAAHLVNFMGTDTIKSIMFMRKYYQETMAGFSIPASEHSTMTSWTRANEHGAYENMIQQFGDGPLFACVSDSWDFEYAVEQIWGRELKAEVEAMNAQLVIRPDSGDAKSNIKFALEKLDQSFGSTVNTKGYKVLNNVALIQGDGVCKKAIVEILTMMEQLGYSAENIAFGMGGALLQGNADSSINRDTHKFAIKCSAIKMDGELIDVYKDPKGSTFKRSKKGRLDLIKENGQYVTININDYQDGEYHQDTELELVFENGKVCKEYTLSEVRL